MIFKAIEKILSIKTDIFITINNDDYNYAKNNLFGSSLYYKLNGIGLSKPSNIKNVKITQNKKIKKILVIGAYKKIRDILKY